jgi:hypothetical protein
MLDGIGQIAGSQTNEEKTRCCKVLAGVERVDHMLCTQMIADARERGNGLTIARLRSKARAAHLHIAPQQI